MSINTFEQQQVNFKIFPVEHSWKRYLFCKAFLRAQHNWGFSCRALLIHSETIL